MAAAMPAAAAALLRRQFENLTIIAMAILSVYYVVVEYLYIIRARRTCYGCFHVAVYYYFYYYYYYYYTRVYVEYILCAPR